MKHQKPPASAQMALEVLWEIREKLGLNRETTPEMTQQEWHPIMTWGDTTAFYQVYLYDLANALEKYLDVSPRDHLWTLRRSQRKL